MFILDTPPFKLPDYPLSAGFKFQNATLGDIISSALQYIYVIAGLSLLVMLIAGGVELMAAAGDEDAMKSGYGKIKTSLIGFLIVFVSYFVVQIVEVVFGIQIL